MSAGGYPYFDTDHAIVEDVVDSELGPLLDAVRRLVDLGDQGRPQA